MKKIVTSSVLKSNNDLITEQPTVIVVRKLYMVKWYRIQLIA